MYWIIAGYKTTNTFQMDRLLPHPLAIDRTQAMGDNFPVNFTNDIKKPQRGNFEHK